MKHFERFSNNEFNYKDSRMRAKGNYVQQKLKQVFQLIHIFPVANSCGYCLTRITYVCTDCSLFTYTTNTFVYGHVELKEFEYVEWKCLMNFCRHFYVRSTPVTHETEYIRNAKTIAEEPKLINFLSARVVTITFFIHPPTYTDAVVFILNRSYLQKSQQET